jgi:type III pantothenate kinase
VLLAIDVGNTETVVGLFAEPGNGTGPGGGVPERAGRRGAGAGVPVEGAGPGPREPGSGGRASLEPGSGGPGSGGPRGRRPVPVGEPVDLVRHWRLSTVDARTPDEHALLLRQLLDLEGLGPEAVGGIAVASSVPAATAALREMAARWFRVPLVALGPGVRSGMPILYDSPREVGPDRVANAIGCYDLYGGPSIVVDLGTATTFDAISAAGEYLGGAIAPGVGISLDALFHEAAALRRVELVEPRSAIGRSTAESIQSGVLYGFAAQVDGLCERIQDELGPATVVATGGLSELIAPFTRCVEIREPWLTLHGLRIAFHRNHEGGVSG